MVILSNLQFPDIIIFLNLVLNTGFLFIILACFAVTIIFDVLRHPWGSKQFFWRHWWHTPLLAYILIPIIVFLPPIVSGAAGFYGGSAIAGAVVLPIVLWVLFTGGDPFSLPSASTRKKHILRAANVLMIAGSLCSLIILSLNLLLWLTSLELLAALIAGVLLYFAGFLLRFSASESTQPEET